MKNELHVVGIQADLIWENPAENLKFFEDKIKNLSASTDLVILPEMFTTGFTMQPKNVAESMNGLSITWMKKIANEYDIAITGSLVIEDGNQFYNRLVFIQPSGKIDVYDKRHSFTLAGEHKVYSSGTDRIIIDFKGWKICPLICYDLRFPVWARNTENYDILIYMANWPVTRIKAWRTLLKARAIENMSYTIGVNRTGLDANNYQYSGSSLIVDYLGETLSNLDENEVGIISAVLKKDHQNKVRNKLGFLKDKDSFTINK
ncbi:amidohydrolase [Polaribacter sp. MED152]|uniref:amidohydrolase n=1 Tax=Polaribacter sp. MED152 TaxID=313598 RepID=UPI000068C982|nr:amidohydrolase [Polaribacter sp. MED152]EAQ42930.1 carbon-nitrogen hydrolase [Polaribacter sp. MED152]